MMVAAVAPLTKSRRLSVWFIVLFSLVGQMEALAVFLWRNAHQALERASHGFGAAEAAFFGDEFDRLGRFFKSAPRGFYAYLQNETRGRHANLFGEDPREISRAHPGLGGHSLDAQRFAQVV